VKYIVIFIVLISSSIKVQGSHYLIPSSIDVRVYVAENGLYEKVGVAAKLTEKKKKIQELMVIIDKKEIPIAAKAYENIMYPNLDTLQIRYSSTNDEDVYVYLEYDGKSELEAPPSIMFLVSNGVYRGVVAR
jgi:hypothetical protein